MTDFQWASLITIVVGAYLVSWGLRRRRDRRELRVLRYRVTELERTARNLIGSTNAKPFPHGLTPAQIDQQGDPDFWGPLTVQMVAAIQLCSPVMVMPYEIFHRALTRALEREVLLDELKYPAVVLRELILKLRGTSE